MAVGNYLNGSTFRGQAYGFTLDTLNKLRDTRANDQSAKFPGVTTLLHYVITLSDDQKLGFVDFLEEMPHVESAARINFAAMQASVRALRTNVNALRKEMEDLRAADSPLKEDHFVDLMLPFFEQADNLVKRIEQVSSGTEQSLKDLLDWLGEDGTNGPFAKQPEDFWSLLGAFHGSVQVHP